MQARADELEAANQVLRERDRWLETTATAANELLSATDTEASVRAALATIGENLECDRLSVMQHILDDDAAKDNLGLMRTLYEWDAEGITAQSDRADLVDIPADGIEDWFRQVIAGQTVGGLVDELDEPFRSGQRSLGVKSTYAVPVLVEGKLWGIVAMDHCREARKLSAAELAVFQTAASCVGSAIYQAQIRRDRAAQERAKLLDSVAEVANLLLRSADFVEVLPEVTRLLGEAVGSDRCSVGQDVVREPSGDIAVKPLCEWAKEGLAILPESSPDFLVDGLIPIEGSFLDFRKTLLRGEVVNFLTEELSTGPKEFMEQQGVTSMLLVPIFVEGQCWGSIGFDNCGEPRLYDEAEIAILKVAAESIAAAIARQAQDEALRESEKAVLAEREKAAQVRAEKLAETNEAIAQTLTTLTTTPELDDFLGQILVKISEPIEACKANLFLYDEETETLSQYISVHDGHVYSGSAPRDPELFRHPIPVSDCLAGWEMIASSSKPWTLDETNQDDAHLWWPESIAWHKAEGHRAVTCACLRVGNKPIGFIGFAFRRFTNLTDEQLEFIQALTNQATLSIQLTRLAEEAKQAAIAQEQEKAAQARAEKLAETNDAIAQTLTTLAASPELDQFLGTILAEMSHQLNAAKVHLFLYDAPTHTLTQRVVVQDGQIYLGLGPNDPEMFNQPFPADITPGWEHIINGERPLTYDEALPIDEEIWWPETIEWHKAQGHKAITCIPLKAGDVPIGFIGYCFRDRTFLSDEQLEFMQALANQAIVAIQLTRLGEEAKQAAILQEQERAAQSRAEQLSRSNQALKSNLDLLAKQPDLDAFLQGVVEEATTQTGADTGHIFLFSADRQTVQLHVSTDNNGDWRSVPDMALWLQPVPTDEAPDFWAKIFERKAFVWEDMQSTLKPGPHIWEPSIEWHLRRGHTSAICAPLVLGDRVLGFFGLAFVGETNITQEDVELAQALTNQATLAIQFTRLAEEARQAAILQEQEKAARDRVAELAKTNEALGQTLSVLTTTPKLDDFLGQVLCKISEPVSACKTLLFLYNEEAHTLHAHLSVHNGQHIYKGTAPRDPEMFHHPIPADVSPAWDRIVNSSKPWMLEKDNPADANLWWPESLPWNRAEGHCAAICAVMKVGGSPIGFIALTFRTVPTLTNEQLEFIQALTNQATLAIHLTRLADRAKTNALSVAVTEERNRLAREIHDTLAQAFTGISLQLEAAKDSFAESLEDAFYHVDRAGGLARQGLSEARRSVRALRSQALTTDTLPNALRTALREMTQDSSTAARVRVIGTPYALPEIVQTNLLRIGQEATTNTLRHAKASSLELSVAFAPDSVKMTVRDNGVGTNVSLDSVEGFGLTGMRERVFRCDGQFSFTSSPGNGTVIEIVIPTSR